MSSNSGGSKIPGYSRSRIQRFTKVQIEIRSVSQSKHMKLAVAVWPAGTGISGGEPSSAIRLDLFRVDLHDLDIVIRQLPCKVEFLLLGVAIRLL